MTELLSHWLRVKGITTWHCLAQVPGSPIPLSERERENKKIGILLISHKQEVRHIQGCLEMGENQDHWTLEMVRDKVKPRHQ